MPLLVMGLPMQSVIGCALADCKYLPCYVQFMDAMKATNDKAIASIENIGKAISNKIRAALSRVSQLPSIKDVMQISNCDDVCRTYALA
eukprot:scaffold131106_cov47-Prasinocladus_malaysianus.AAC.1